MINTFLYDKYNDVSWMIDCENISKYEIEAVETFLLFHHGMQQEFDYFVIHMVTHKHMVYPKTGNYDKKTKISTDLLTCRVLAERCNLPI